ncbi:glycoside hydrolase family 16 protein [Luteolibacter arcticus]|uniref:Glycoside hydrolase family 16 protein n=1 Tax=Luteolibacter arcticus TaxID=1581411 RepID=A0ABT3GSF2_9BACT|nr:glycoside hydrolase family 16 protein [Luteolibacter arcticus]MCW1926466.1 glycoside hydrolase family 16 protein [Luteolibacter arcticus]
MKFYAILLLSASLAHAQTPAQTPAPAGWKLVWSDEFNGKEIDFSKWGVEENGHGGGNGELQYYVDRPENLRIEDGHLVIEAKKEKFNAAGVQKDYTSGRLRTKRRASWLYGRFEMRAKLPTGRGIWPAFWMLPTKDAYGGWAASGEIDIMELVGHEPSKAHGTLHHGGTWPKNVHTGTPFELKKGTFADDFHTFAAEWEKGEIRWYVDGELYQTQTKWSSTGGQFPAPFDQPFYLVLNVAVGGGWPGPPDAKTVFPQRMTVDWVRVYQRP